MIRKEYIGFDFGTIFIKVGYWDFLKRQTAPLWIPKLQKEKIISLIAFLPKYNQWVTGELAFSILKEEPLNVFIGIKTALGRSDEASTEKLALKEFFTLYKNIIKELFPADYNLVISIPYCFYANQREELIATLEKAQFEFLEFIHDPEAIVLNYIYENPPLSKQNIVCVIDLGGNKLDIALFEVKRKKQQTIITTLDVRGASGVGGLRIDEDLSDIILKEVFLGGEIKANPLEVKHKLWPYVVELKHSLTTQEKATLFLDRIFPHLAYFKEITRQQLTKIALFEIKTVETLLKEILAEQDISLERIDKVLVTGGTTRIPDIKESIVRLFGKQAERVVFLEKDTAVAEGAALKSAILGGEVKGLDIKSINPYSVGVELENGDMDIILPRGKILPISRKKLYKVSERRNSLKIRAFQGEKEVAFQNQFIKEFNVMGIREAEQIIIEVITDINGLVAFKVYLRHGELIYSEE